MKKIILLLVAVLFFISARPALKADTGVPVAVSFTTDTQGFQVATPGSNGVYLDGIIVTKTAPAATGATATFQLYDLGGPGLGLTTAASLKLSYALTVSGTTQTLTIPTCGIYFANGIRYVDADTTTLTATFLKSSR